MRWNPNLPLSGKLLIWVGLWLTWPAALRAQHLLPPVPVSAQSEQEAPEKAETQLDESDSKDVPTKKDADSCGCADFWSKSPPVRIFPRLGNFFVPPKGPGYYSLLDVVHHNYREGPPKFPYPPLSIIAFSFFDADFRYLEDPKNTQHDWTDVFHRIHLGNNWLFSTGGDFRWRHMHEVNSRLSGTTNDYDLLRTRVYGDLWYKDRLRFYLEYLDAQSFNENLPSAVIDVNHSDLLNAFVDIKIGEYQSYPAYVRIGRQEILLGSERLITPGDWFNTRRAFQGVRAFRQGEKFDADLFWVQPVVPNPTRFDSADNNQNFAGAWFTYRPEKGHFRDFYYLYLDNSAPVKQLKGAASIDPAPFSVHTLGTRFAGEKNQVLYDLEAMLQLGKRGSQDIVAGAFSTGGGYHFANAPMNPQFWVYYDYATGDRSPNGGSQYNTFNQLFPFGHYYLGWVDAVGRQNIHDLNAHVYLFPTKWITVWGQFHHFMLDSSTDALYNAAGVATRRDPTGKVGRNVGNEIDIVVNFHLSRHSDIMAGYSKLFAGNFLRSTGPGTSPEFFFLQYTYRW